MLLHIKYDLSPWPAEQVSEISQALTEALGIGNFQINAFNNEVARLLIPEGNDEYTGLAAIKSVAPNITIKKV